MDYKVDVVIDENALDVECLQQAELGIKWGNNWAHHQKLVQKAEEKVKIIRAELIAEASEHPEKYLGKDVKVTGPTIEAYYRTHERHKTAKTNLINAQFDLNVAEIAKKEISVTRKAQLANLIELQGQNYFSGPTEPRDLSHEAMKRRMQKKVDAGVSKSLKRKDKK